jgi:Protein of unknown function (DUF1570)
MRLLSALLALVLPASLVALPACTSTERASPAPSAVPRATQAKQAPQTPQASPSMRADGQAAPAGAPAPAPAAAAAEPPPAAVYDLAADRERRARVARDELGARTQTVVVSDIFVVIGPSGWQGGAFDNSVSLMKNAMAGYMNDRFGKKPDHAISVYLFPSAAPYEAFCKKQYAAPCIATYGFYQPGDRYMVMNAGLGIGTLTHEIVHPLVETDFPNAPTWLNEGIASVFEAPSIPKVGEIHGVKNWRHPRLVRAMKSAAEKEHAKLDTLFGMPDTTFRSDAEDLHYAMARYVCQWLDGQGKLWPFYQRWRDHAAEDPTGEKSFEEVVGMKPSRANAAWTKWVLAL